MKYLFFILLLSNTIFAQRDSIFYKMSAQKFLSLPQLNQPIDVRNPDFELLDAALFQATNEQRIAFNLPIFQYSSIIHQAAIGHSVAMINQDFYNHDNPFDATNKSLPDRIFRRTKAYRQLAENIAQHDVLMAAGNMYCFTPPKSGGDFYYYDCKTKKVLPMMTYAEFARSVVNGWMNSPHHRANILDSKLKFMACSGRISKNPYKSQRSPFARLTQDFGG